MIMLWERGPLFVRQMVESYPAPQPHFNTVSTVVRTLEDRGLVGHRQFGGTYQYYPAVSADEFRSGKISGVVARYFEGSYMGVVSTLVRDEKIDVEELKQLIAEIEQP